MGEESYQCGECSGSFEVDWATLSIMSNDHGPIDVLLSHDGLPNTVKHGKGTKTLRDPIELLDPQFHFFGHYHRRVAPIDYSTLLGNSDVRTLGVHINKLMFDPHHNALREQVAGHFVIAGSNELRFSFIEDDWLQNMRKKNEFHT